MGRGRSGSILVFAHTNIVQDSGSMVLFGKKEKSKDWAAEVRNKEPERKGQSVFSFDQAKRKQSQHT
jgi:hypothetical protein